MAATVVPVAPPRLIRAMTDRTPPKKVPESEGPVASTSKKAAKEEHDAVASSSTLRETAARARTRSVSSHAVPVTQISFLNADAAQRIERGSGTPDFTVASSSHSRRKESEHRMPSLGQGLRLISEQSASGSTVRRARSSSDVSISSPGSSSTSKKKAVAPLPATRPRLATLRSFLTSFGASTAAPDASVEDSQKTDSTRMPHRPQPLVMPAARTAGPNGLRGLNNDSPPLTPVSDGDDQSEYQHYLRTFQNPNLVRQVWNKYQGAPKHQWSAAQAAADAASDERQLVTPPPTSQWPFTPPLSTTESSASSRAFSPPAWLESTNLNAWLPGILPSHSSRPPTPASTNTTSSPTSSHIYNAFDGEVYRIDSISKSLSAFLPRISINLSSWRISMPNLRPFLPQLGALFVIFVAATTCIVMMLSTLPLVLPKHISGLTLNEIKDVAFSLKDYSNSSNKAFYHTLVVIGTFFTWKQSFTVPGSLIMNVVFGAMYGTYWGTLYTSTFTAIGGVFCYLLSAPLAPLITSLPGLAKPLDAMRRALSPVRAQGCAASDNGSVWTYLLVLRVLPVVPYGLMNIACGVLRVPLLPYAVTLAVGSIPWNFVTCQVGDLLQEIVEALPAQDGLTSTQGGGMRAILDHIWNRRMVVKLVLLSIASLAPMVLSRYLKTRQAAPQAQYQPVSAVDEHRSSDEEDCAGSRPASQHFYEMEQRSNSLSPLETRRLAPAWL